MNYSDIAAMVSSRSEETVGHMVNPCATYTHLRRNAEMNPNDKVAQQIMAVTPNIESLCLSTEAFVDAHAKYGGLGLDRHIEEREFFLNNLKYAGELTWKRLPAKIKSRVEPVKTPLDFHIETIRQKLDALKTRHFYFRRALTTHWGSMHVSRVMQFWPAYMWDGPRKHRQTYAEFFRNSDSRKESYQEAQTWLSDLYRGLDLFKRQILLSQWWRHAYSTSGDLGDSAIWGQDVREHFFSTYQSMMDCVAGLEPTTTGGNTCTVRVSPIGRVEETGNHSWVLNRIQVNVDAFSTMRKAIVRMGDIEEETSKDSGIFVTLRVGKVFVIDEVGTEHYCGYIRTSVPLLDEYTRAYGGFVPRWNGEKFEDVLELEGALGQQMSKKDPRKATRGTLLFYPQVPWAWREERVLEGGSTYRTFDPEDASPILTSEIQDPDEEPEQAPSTGWAGNRHSADFEDEFFPMEDVYEDPDLAWS